MSHVQKRHLRSQWDMSPDLSRRHGLAWIGLSLAFALHVTDEALNDFLSVYNPIVHRLRQAVPLLPLPTFEFGLWLAGLILAVAVLLPVAAFVFRSKRWTVPASYIYGGFMCLNALGHFGGSIAFRRFMPGVYSSPALLAAALWLILSARRRRAGTPRT